MVCYSTCMILPFNLQPASLHQNTSLSSYIILAKYDDLILSMAIFDMLQDSNNKVKKLFVEGYEHLLSPNLGTFTT